MNPDVGPTNNRTERAFRPSAIYRKISSGSRYERGAEIYKRICSIYYTSRLRKNNFITDTPSVMSGEVKPG